MVFRYTEWMRSLAGEDRYPGLPNFDPPERVVTLRKPLRECTVAILTSAGVQPTTDATQFTSQFAYDPPQHFDHSYRYIPRETPLSELVVKHTSPSRVWAEQDLNVVYPRDPLVELERQGVIGRLAKRAVSFLGNSFQFSDMISQIVPSIVPGLQEDEVDLALLIPL